MTDVGDFTQKELEAMYIEAVNAGRDDISYDEFVVETLNQDYSNNTQSTNKNKDKKNDSGNRDAGKRGGKKAKPDKKGKRNKSKSKTDDSKAVSPKKSKRSGSKKTNDDDMSVNGISERDSDAGSKAEKETPTDSIDAQDNPLDDKDQRIVDDEVLSVAQDGGLTRRQERFCIEFIKDYNQTQAAIRAGFSKNSAHVAGSRLLRNDKVVEYIKTLERPIVERAMVTAERLQEEYEALAMANLDDFVRLDSRGQPVIDLSNAIGNRAVMAGLSQLEVREAGTQELVIGGNEIEREVFNTKIKIGDKIKAMEFLAKRLGIQKEDTGPTINNNITMDSNEIAQRLSLILRKQTADIEAEKIAETKSGSKTAPSKPEQNQES